MRRRRSLGAPAGRVGGSERQEEGARRQQGGPGRARAPRKRSPEDRNGSIGVRSCSRGAPGGARPGALAPPVRRAALRPSPLVPPGPRGSEGATGSLLPKYRHWVTTKPRKKGHAGASGAPRAWRCPPPHPSRRRASTARRPRRGGARWGPPREAAQGVFERTRSQGGPGTEGAGARSQLGGAAVPYLKGNALCSKIERAAPPPRAAPGGGAARGGAPNALLKGRFGPKLARDPTTRRPANDSGPLR